MNRKQNRGTKKYTMGFYSRKKKNEILLFTSKWMEVSQAQNAKNCMFSLTWGLQT
jgi:hypothetical protein